MRCRYCCRNRMINAYRIGGWKKVMWINWAIIEIKDKKLIKSLWKSPNTKIYSNDYHYKSMIMIFIIIICKFEKNYNDSHCTEVRIIVVTLCAMRVIKKFNITLRRLSNVLSISLMLNLWQTASGDFVWYWMFGFYLLT